MSPSTTPTDTGEGRLNSYSLVKTLVGVLTLRAVADGRLALETPLAEALGTDAPDAVAVGDVLAMRAGLTLAPEPAKAASGAGDKALDDAAFSPFGALARLHAFGPDVLDDRLAPRPEGLGEFEYQSAYTALLGAMVERAYDRPLQDVLSELIWRPAGAGDAQWRRYPRDERATAYCCLYARPVDWARVGAFLLANGTADTPFLPEPLWREFVLPNLGAARRAGAYGWHVRHDVLDRDGAALAGPFAYAMGHNGQMLYLLPAWNVAVVRFGAELQLLHSTLYELAPLIADD